MTNTQQPSSLSSVVAHFNELYQRLARQRRSLEHIALCFRDQSAMLPLQCMTTIERLDTLRQTARRLSRCLCSLDPQATQRLRPYACIDKLTLLDYQLTEIILNVAMLAPICQAVSFERVDLHLHIRSLFPRALVAFEDTMSQLATLTDAERQAAQEHHSAAASSWPVPATQPGYYDSDPPPKEEARVCQ